jgi:PncC family amidohydrolase
MQELASVIKEFMLKRGETISVAESLTSGYLQAHMSAVAGSSKYFAGGITAYNIDMKVKFLNVDRANAETCDCVSEQTAIEMAKGVVELFDTDYGVATTGYVDKENSKGMAHAYFAIYSRRDRKLHSFFMSCTHLEERTEIQAYFARLATEKLVKFLTVDL